MKITITQQTPLKFKLDQSSNLNQSQQILLSKNTELNLQKVKTQQNHLVSNFYAWAEHWDVVDEKNNGNLPVIVSQIDWTNSDSRISKYFSVGEVTNNDPRRIPTDNTIKQNIITLAQELDKVREAWGSGIIVTSWYRPPAVNRAIGGATRSQHLSGKAADIRPVQGDLYRFQDWLDKGLWSDKALGYGAKKGFVHVDLRPGKIRWNY